MPKALLLVLGFVATIAAAAPPRPPVAEATDSWDGGSCKAALYPDDGGCLLDGVIFEAHVTDAFHGRFHGESQEVGKLAAHPQCGHAVRACGKLLSCRCGPPIKH
ncbi:MAG: hypothetical protein JST54_28155 [Deltaproteobacteria bacterium]|nr:hypothetical protein [Deltaproteobacteria bacterium]